VRNNSDEAVDIDTKVAALPNKEADSKCREWTTYILTRSFSLIVAASHGAGAKWPIKLFTDTHVGKPITWSKRVNVGCQCRHINAHLLDLGRLVDLGGFGQDELVTGCADLRNVGGRHAKLLIEKSVKVSPMSKVEP